MGALVFQEVGAVTYQTLKEHAPPAAVGGNWYDYLGNNINVAAIPILQRFVVQEPCVIHICPHHLPQASWILSHGAAEVAALESDRTLENFLKISYFILLTIAALVAAVAMPALIASELIAVAFGLLFIVLAFFPMFETFDKFDKRAIAFAAEEHFGDRLKRIHHFFRTHSEQIMNRISAELSLENLNQERKDQLLTAITTLNSFVQFFKMPEVQAQ